MASEIVPLSRLLQVPRDEMRDMLGELVKTSPEVLRRWVEWHPANLMYLLGTQNNWVVKPFHLQAIEDFLRYRETMWLAPRGSGKSLALAVIVPAWLAIARPENMDPRFAEKLFASAPHPIGPHNIRIALTSNSEEKATALLFQVKAILTSSLMHSLFGALKGTERWQEAKADTYLRTEKLREATFTALGIGSKIAGGHYDVVIADDWVTEDNARTALQRERMSNFWKFTIKGTQEPWCRVIVAGTRYHPADWYAEIKGWHEKGLWGNVRRTPAIDDAGTSYWPEMYPIEKFREIREQIGSIAFMSQFQNVVEAMLGDFFKRNWVENYYKWAELPADIRAKARTVIALDPAVAQGPKADFSAFCVVSYIPPHFYVRKVMRGQWTQFELLAIARQLYEEYRPERFGIEDVGAFKWLIQELHRMTRIPLRALHPRGVDKIGRADRVRTFFEQMRVFIEEPAEGNEMGRLHDELLAFPNSSAPGWDDTVDALVWALLMMSLGGGKVYKMGRGRF